MFPVESTGVVSTSGIGSAGCDSSRSDGGGGDGDGGRGGGGSGSGEDVAGGLVDDIPATRPEIRVPPNVEGQGSTPSLKDLFLYVSLHRKIL